MSLQAGIIEELMDDTFESLEDEDLEEEADEAVEAILFEVTKGMCVVWLFLQSQFEEVNICVGQLGKAGAVSNAPLNVKVSLMLSYPLPLVFV